MLPADTVHPVLADLVAPVLQLVAGEAVAKGRVVSVQIEEIVGQVRVLPGALADRVGEPLLEGRASKAEHPAGPRDGEALVGQSSDQRELHCGRASLAK